MASIKAASCRRSLKHQDSAVWEGTEKWCLVSLNHLHERIWFSNRLGRQDLPSSLYLLFVATGSYHDLSQNPSLSFSLLEPDHLVSQTHRHSCSARSPPPSHSASIHGPSSGSQLLKGDGSQGAN